MSRYQVGERGQRQVGGFGNAARMLTATVGAGLLLGAAAGNCWGMAASVHPGGTGSDQPWPRRGLAR